MYDDCNCDGFKNSIYTISITGVTGNGTKPVYTESCSATLAATYSADTPQHEWDSTPGIVCTGQRAQAQLHHHLHNQFVILAFHRL
jgi:hypothetical protein